MPLVAPNLDDRTFDQLVDAARERIKATAPEWTDLSAGDPGMTLVEVFAYLAETMIYRLNRVPDKLYVEFLRLIGVRLIPPAAAAVTLRFTRDKAAPPADIEIPRGTRVTTGTPGSGTDAPVFATTAHAVLAQDQDSIDLPALNAEAIAGELVGVASGQPGTWFALAHPPVIAPTGDPLDLLVGVEATADELSQDDPAIEWQDKTYRVWREANDFSDPGPDDRIYIADRSSGVITFAPAARMARAADDGGGPALSTPRALAGVPVAGREVRVWYRRGGGLGGNVSAETLTAMRDTIAGLAVTNPAPATGGRDQETVENALVRGPQELRSLARAVSARDYQLVAERSSGAIARARAFTQAALWRYATPGTVEVVIVPALPGRGGEAGVTAEQLESLETEEARQTVVRVLDQSRPMGTSLEVNWARYKTVKVEATIVVRAEEDVTAVRNRVNERLRLTVNPLHNALSVGGWPFGQPLFASAVYKIILSEPGVRYARGIRLVVDDVPNVEVRALATDSFQPRTWYAGSGNRFFRSLNDGEGWEQMANWDVAQITTIRSNPWVPGLVAAATSLGEGAGSRIFVSTDSGTTWDFTREFGVELKDLAWSQRDDAPLLLMATSGGLYQMKIDADADPVQLLVDPANQNLPFYAVVATQEIRGEMTIAAAAQSFGGVFLSSDGGNSFRHIGLNGEDVRVLSVQRDGPRSFLWAAVAAPGSNEPGKGAFRRELLGEEDPGQGWSHFGNKWQAGSCWALAFAGSIVLAATQDDGVMRLDLRDANPGWDTPTVNCGLPLRDTGRFHPVWSVATSPDGQEAMAGGPVGVFRVIEWDAEIQVGSKVLEPRYEECSRAAFQEEVTLPPTWLFTCSDNDIKVGSDAPA